MAQLTFRVNVGAAAFPLLSSDHPQTAILGDYDQNYAPVINSGSDFDKDFGIPQMYYAHNVMPTEYGLATASYAILTDPIPGQNSLVQQFEVRNPSGERAYIAVDNVGKFYVAEAPYSTWAYVQTIAAAGSGLITYGTVRGQTYIYVEATGCYTYNFSTVSLDSVTLSGLTPSSLTGIGASSGYLLAYTDTDVLNSSTLDPTDFIPSLTTGAGSLSVESAQARINLIVEAVGGFLVFTDKNTVSASYSGNARYPFNFRAVPGAGGLNSTDYVTYDESQNVVYAYTTSGLQAITLQKAEVFLPQVTDFLSGGVFEDYDVVTRAIYQTRSLLPLKKKVTLVADRYLLLSYGVNSLTHCVVYDLALKRMGKLKFQHVDVMEFTSLPLQSLDVPKKSIAFMQQDGSVYLIDMINTGLETDAVMLFGRFQLRRGNMQTLNYVSVANVPDDSPNSQLFIVPSLNGHTQLSPVEGSLGVDTPVMKGYDFALHCKNFTIVLTGNYRLNTIEGVVYVTGRERKG